jgi:hypothetical protein
MRNRIANSEVQEMSEIDPALAEAMSATPQTIAVMSQTVDHAPLCGAVAILGTPQFVDRPVRSGDHTVPHSEENHRPPRTPTSAGTTKGPLPRDEETGLRHVTTAGRGATDAR